MSEMVKLNTIVDLQNGFAFKSNDYVKFSNTLLCRMGNIKPDKGFVLNYKPKYISDNIEKYNQYILNDGDIIIAMTDLANDPKILGVPVLVKTEGKVVLQNQRVGKLVIKSNDVYPPYLMRVLSTKQARNFYKQFSNGGLQINIGKKEILANTIPLPSLTKQKQIAKRLDKAKELIELRQDSISKLDELSKSIFIDMFGDPVGNPMKWDNLELNDVCEITSSKRIYKSDYVEKGIPFYKIKEIILKSKKIKLKKIEYISEDTFENFATKFGYPQKYDILITAVGATIGHFYLVEDNEKFYFKDGNLIWLRNYKFDINKKYLISLFRNEGFKNKICNLSNGAAQDAITIVKLKKTTIPLPNISLQNKFTDIIQKIEQQKSLYQEQLTKLQENFDALLSESFSV